jgi:tetratricopeptide (TPR) repeat protein
LLAELLHKNAHIELRRKHYQLAAYQWQKALDEVEKMEQIDIHLQATILLHLGSVHKMLGSINDSIMFYNQAVQLFNGLGTSYDMAKAFLELGKAYRKINDLDRAAAYSEKAAAIFEASENILTVIKTKVQTASLYVVMQRGDEALPLLEQAIQQLHDLGNREEEGIALVELAKLKLQNGEANEAEDLCHRARILLPDSHLYLAWINRILGKIALHRDQRDKAIRRFHKAADCFKLMEDVTEWDGTMYEISRLHIEEDDLIRACSILEEIRRYTRQVLEERGIML